MMKHAIALTLIATLSLPAQASPASDFDDATEIDTIAFGSCFNPRHKKFQIFDGILKQKPDAFLFLGDNIYGDTEDMELLKKKYAERRATMAEALEKHGLVESNAAKFGGTSFWIKGPIDLNTDVPAEKLMARGVLIDRGSPFFGTANPPKNYFRISYSSIPNSRIAEGVERIAETIDGLRTRNNAGTK